MPPQPQITFLVDENCGTTVSNVLRDRGHIVRLSIDIAGTGAVDELVLITAQRLRATIVTSDGDFKAHVARTPESHSKWRHVGCLRVPNIARVAVYRLEALLPLVEFEHQEVAKLTDKRAIITIGQDFFTVER